MKQQGMGSIVGLDINAGDADFPTSFARGRVTNSDVATGGDERAVDSPTPQNFERFICGEPFADAAQIESHVWHEQSCGLGASVEAKVFPTDSRARRGEFLCCGKRFSLARKAPQPDAGT